MKRDGLTLLERLIKFARDVWMVLGITVAMFVALEAVVSLGFYVRGFWHPPAANFRIKADTYSDTEWASKYYKEIEEVENGRTLRWQPYVYWRRTPRRGQYINIGSDGLRKTINVSTSEGAGPPIKVFMFGGSTMWGLGAGDDSTIPSIFAEEAKNKGINCDVVNFGQYAYVSTQEIIELTLQLQKGNIPDVAIFYDGVNDTFSGFQLSVPGLPHDEIRREKEFCLLERKELQTLAVQSAIRQLSTMRFLHGVLQKSGLRPDNFQPVPLEYEKAVADKGELAHAVTETYLNNIKLVQTLSRSYGFTSLFYWQPVIYTKRHLTEYERQSLELDVHYPGMKEFYQDTYAALRQSSAGLNKDVAFHDISSIFSDIREPIFVDFNHMGDKGNRAIAQRMAKDFVHLLKVNTKPPMHSGLAEQMANSEK
jgi:lysophospholipase L1-like esterase